MSKVWELNEKMPDVSGETSIDEILTDRLGNSKVCASGKLKEEGLSYLARVLFRHKENSIPHTKMH